MTIVSEPVTGFPTTETAAATDVLLEVLDDAIDFCARHEDDEPHTGTPVGRVLADLAALARRTVQAIGADGGTPLAEAAGVVVVRELVNATRLLQRTVAAGGSDAPSGTVAEAKSLHARLWMAMTAAR